MANRNLLRQFDLSDQDLDHELQNALVDNSTGGVLVLDEVYREERQEFEVNKILLGRVANIVGDDVVVDIGYKSEGIIPLQEWYDEGEDKINPPHLGDKIQVLLDAVEDDSGAIVLSFRKAKRQKEWQDVIAKHKEGDVVKGLVSRKIKGGLLVNIGVHVFLPASQVDIRRPPDIGEFINREIDCMILKIDDARRNIVVSRRRLLEVQRDLMKKKLLAEIEPGQVRKGIVKNIAEFGAFVDLGGIDGLMHITDMSWGRISNPREVVHIDQQLDVFIISIDKDREKIALGLKQKSPSPWAGVADKYPVGSQHNGEVVNVMSYGAFVKLEPGVEGLVHISEMSWTRRINHPSELVNIGDRIAVQVLNINKEKQEISLGMKQVQPNPWDKVAEHYPPNTPVTGVVRNLTNYGAFVEIEEGIDGLLHLSDMSWVRKVAHPSEVVQKGDRVTCVVLNVDQERKRIALGLKQMNNDPWEGDIPGRYKPGEIKKGKVTKLTNFGAFVELEPGLEGLLHVSELADRKIENAEDVVKVGDQVEVKILRVDAADRKIGLSRKRLGWTKEEEREEDPGAAGADANSAAKSGAKAQRELRGGTGAGSSGQLISMPESGEKK
jgi:small subunit ribosomal protein S1